MAKKDFERKFLARDRASYFDMAKGLLLGSVEFFNRNCLPVLSDLGIFESHDFSDYYKMTKDSFVYRFVAKAKKKGKDDEERDYYAYKAKEFLKEYQKEHDITAPQEYYEQYLDYVSFDEDKFIFVFDEERFDRLSDIYIETPEEHELYKKLIAVLESLKAIRWSRESQLKDFIRFEGDELEPCIWPVISRGCWEALKEINKK